MDKREARYQLPATDEIRLRKVNRKYMAQLQNIASNLDIKVPDLVKQHLIFIIEKYPESYRETFNPQK